MISVVACANPFEPTRRRSLELKPGSTIRQALTAADLGDRLPVIAGVDGDWWLRKRWDEPIPDGALVQLEAVVTGGGNSTSMWLSIAEIVVGVALLFGEGTQGVGIALIAGGVVGLASSLLIQTPHLPSSLSGESGSPTYALDMRNRKRVGEPIPVLYGRHRLVPDLVASPYVEYDTDNQYLYQVLCLGAGEFDIEDIRIADSEIDRLQNLSYEIVEPGDTLTLFRDNVTTSTIVQGQTLRATNEVTKPENMEFTITDVGGGVMRITVSVPFFFAGIAVHDPIAPAVGNTVDISNCSNNGSFEASALDGTSGQWVEVFNGGTITPETPKAGGFNCIAVARTIHIPAGDSSFVASSHTINDPTKKRFAGWNPGDQIEITNTTDNDTTVTIVTVAGDGSWATVTETLIDESNANPTFSLTTGGYVGPFPVNAWGTALQSIGVDILFPKGLTNNGGSYTVTVQIDAREIDADGAPVGGWTTLGTETITRASFSPVRISYEYAKPSGGDRWEVKAKRTSATANAITVLEDCVWGGLRGYLPDIGTYPDVTVLAIRVRASEQIPADVAQQINVIATRKLPIWDGTVWSLPAATRNPAWALADILRNDVYGAGLADERVDLPALLVLAQLWDDREDWFDAVFDQTDTMWSALVRVARVGRAAPLVVGGLITFVRDQERTTRTALYGPHQMVKGSFAIDYTFKKEDDPDGIDAAWIDPTTWQPAHVEATVSGDPADRPAQVDLFGITDEDHATREALYLARVDAYQRKVIRFSTEMDGHIPVVSDLITISHDVPNWGKSGHILALAGTIYTTSEAISWTPATTHYVAFRRPNGSLCGPFVATMVNGDDHAFVCADALDFDLRTDHTHGDRTVFLFGPGTTWGMDVVVMKISPRDQHIIELICQPYDARIYAAGV